VRAIDGFSKTDLTGSEANTKNKIIEPLLETLGWNIRGNEVMLEYPIKIGSTTKFVDYALLIEGKPVILVEAKAFDTVLLPDDSSQVISYGRVEDIQWVVLTNGRDLKIFDTKAGKAENECLVTSIDLRKLPLQANDLKLISRESILTGEIEEAAKRLTATKIAVRKLEQNQQEIAEEFKEILLKTTGKDIENRIETISKQLAEQAIQLLLKQVETPHETAAANEIRVISRKELVAKPPGEVVLCPSRLEGVEFLKKYNAWGFVAMADKRIPYFALYVGRPESSVLYFGEIDSITQPLKSKEDVGKIQEKDVGTFEVGKRVIHLKQGTLTKFKDPILLKSRRSAPRGLRYTTLENLVQANSIDEL
jgi:predicted type IV restriction endonuclease